jgi:hypothetical protein
MGTKIVSDVTFESYGAATGYNFEKENEDLPYLLVLDICTIILITDIFNE